MPQKPHQPPVCGQSETIGIIVDQLDRMERGQERLVELLGQVANQEARIQALVDRSAKTERDVNGVYVRLRDVEIETDRNNRLKDIAICKPMIAVYTVVGMMILAGAAMDIIFHSEKLQSVIAFLRK